jgi:RNA polymerase sigma factor (sigma-70 family)
MESDPLAPAELAEAFLNDIVRRLRAKANWIRDKTLIMDAATDALLSYAQRPSKFDPSRSSLLSYLTMSAYGDLLNMLARQQRRQKREVPLREDVELKLEDRNNTWQDIEEKLDDHGIDPVEKAAVLRKVEEAFSDPRDRRILDLMLSGERKTSAYNIVLGIQDRNFKEQQRIVKRNKDRITKRLQRLGGKIGGQRQGS